MTIHDVVLAQFNTQQQQIQAYQADITNLLAMLTNLQQSQQVIVQWLAANPSA
jgi:hypothetical protein